MLIAVTLLARPKILTPGTEIYLRNDVSREVSFVGTGEVEVRRRRW